MSESLDLAEGTWFTKEDFLQMYFNNSSGPDGCGQASLFLFFLSSLTCSFDLARLRSVPVLADSRC